jgi:RimJ/RimL family protein N-acetyltransferase
MTITKSNPFVLLTRSLRLVAADRCLLDADLRGRTNGRPGPSLAELLDAETAASWPPELFEADDIERMRVDADRPEATGWGGWYMVSRLPKSGGERGLLAGIIGFGGPPDDRGNVMIGYSVVPEARRRGFASEATRALVDWAFQDARTKQVSAETFPELTPSIRVLERCGFRRSEETPETDGALRFVRIG